MIKNKTILVAGGGGFIGGHMVAKLLPYNTIIAVDIKKKKNWFQLFTKAKNLEVDLKNYEQCKRVTKNVDLVINFACNMGGMGFIENFKAECMLSVLINTNLLRACVDNKVKKYFYASTACVYNINYQNKVDSKHLSEEMAYPAMPEDGYGWEKLFSERMCRHFYEDFKLEVRVARYHNVYGPIGTYDGGREKVPAALCRKVALAKLKNKKTIEIWGDGKQTRSFLYIDDCIKATIRLINSNYLKPLNIGSDRKVSINRLLNIIQKISELKKINKKYLKNKPTGVRGRASDNKRFYKFLKIKHSTSLEEGLKVTYNWIFNQIKNKKNKSKNKFETFKL